MTSILSSLTQARPDAFTVRTVTNGTYTGAIGADGGLAHATNWLILVAQTPYGVIVDDSAGNVLDLTRAKKIMFVGFDFRGIRVLRGSEDINFWWSRGRNTASPADDNTNSLICFNDGGSNRCKRISTCGGEVGTSVSGLVGNDCFGLNSCDSFRVLGAKVQAHSPAAPPNFVHADGIQTTGLVNGVEIGYCDWSGNMQLAGEFGSLTNVNIHDTWAHDSPTGVQFIFGHYDPDATITGTIANCYVFNCPTAYRLDYHGTTYPSTPTQYPAKSIPQWVNVTESGVHLQAPPPGTQNPAEAWQGLNPYGSYLTFLGATPPPGTTFTPVLKKATDATGASLSNLTGSTFSGPFYAVVSPEDGIVSVAFKIDGIPVRTETTAPFSLNGDAGAGALIAYDPALLISGAHTLTGDVSFIDATTQTLAATFTIPAPQGAPTLQLVDVDYNDGQDRTTGAQVGPSTIGRHAGGHNEVGVLANQLATMAINSGLSVAVKVSGAYPPRPLVCPVVIWVGDTDPGALALNGDVWLNTA